MDTSRRTFVKALCWNVLGLATMSLVGLVMTGSAALGGAMAAVNCALGFTMFLIHERMWSRISWGQHG